MIDAQDGFKPPFSRVKSLCLRSLGYWAVKKEAYAPFIFLYCSKVILPRAYRDVAGSTGLLFRPALRFPFFFAVCFTTLIYWFYVMISSVLKV